MTESINSRTRAVEKGKKNAKKNTVNILMHMKKLSRERVRCEAHQHLYPMVERAWLWQSVYHLSYLDQQVRAQVKSCNNWGFFFWCNVYEIFHSTCIYFITHECSCITLIWVYLSIYLYIIYLSIYGEGIGHKWSRLPLTEKE